MQDIFNTILYILIVFLAFIGILFIILKGYDYYLIKKGIWSRKAIGRFDSEKRWIEAVKKISGQWAIQMPKVQVSDNSDFVLLDKLLCKFSINELQIWQRGGLLLGFTECLRKYPEDIETKTLVNNVLKDIFDENYNWKVKPKHISCALLGYAVMKLPQFSESYYKAMRDIIEVIKLHIGKEGTVFYRDSIPNYRLVDTLGMICPFLIKFGYYFEEPEFIDLALKQIREFEKYGVHSDLCIPVHAYHIEHKGPLGIYGWGRGASWYALGLIDSYEELREGHPTKELLKTRIGILAETFVKLQRSDGGWGHSLLLDHTIYDSSTTSMNVYFLKKVIANNILIDECYIKAAENGISRLRFATRKDGTVDFSQGDTKGIGIYSAVFGQSPFTQGMVLRVLNVD